MALGAAVPGASAFLPGAQKTGSAGGMERGTRASTRPTSLRTTWAKIVTAAVYADAEHIVDGIIGLKQRARAPLPLS